jgi:hypothetical protein
MLKVGLECRSSQGGKNEIIIITCELRDDEEKKLHDTGSS